MRLFCVALRIFRRAEDGTLFYGGRLVYEARGRTFRRPSRRNSAGPSPRRRAARHAVRPRPPYTGRSPLHRVPCPGVPRPGLYTKKRAAKARPACPAAPYMRLTAAAPVPLGCFPHIEPSTGPAPTYGIVAKMGAANRIASPASALTVMP